MKELCLTIPCEPAGKPDPIAPIHIYLGKDSSGAEKTAWKCPHCGAINPRRKPLTQHMGLVMNIPACCPVLRKQDADRRESNKNYR